MCAHPSSSAYARTQYSDKMPTVKDSWRNLPASRVPHAVWGNEVSALNLTCHQQQGTFDAEAGRSQSSDSLGVVRRMMRDSLAAAPTVDVM